MPSVESLQRRYEDLNDSAAPPPLSEEEINADCLLAFDYDWFTGILGGYEGGAVLVDAHGAGRIASRSLEIDGARLVPSW